MPLFLTPIPDDVIKQLDRRCQILGDSSTSKSTFTGLSGLTDASGTKWGMQRTPFVRAASFAVIRDSYTQEFIDKYKNSPEGTTFKKVKEEVPSGVITHELKHHHRLRNVLYGGGLYDLSGKSLDKEKYSNLLDDFSDYNRGWNGHFADRLDGYKTRTGNSASDVNSRMGSPMPGITDVTVENVGQLGSLKKIDMNIVCHDFAQLQMIEALYMTPGITVLLEWGWSTDTEGGNVQNNLIDLTKSGFLKDVNRLHGWLLKRARNQNFCYEGAVATITNYSWSAESNGTFKCQVSLRSRGEALLGVQIKDSHSNLIESIKALTTPRNDDKIYEIEQTLQRTKGTSEKAQLGGFDLDADGYIAQRMLENNLSTITNEAYPALYSQYSGEIGTTQFVGMSSNPEGLLPKAFPRFYYGYKKFAAEAKRTKLLDRAKVSIAGGEKSSKLSKQRARNLMRDLIDRFVGQLIMPAIEKNSLNSGKGEDPTKTSRLGSSRIKKVLKKRSDVNASGNVYTSLNPVSNYGWEHKITSTKVNVGNIYGVSPGDMSKIINIASQTGENLISDSAAIKGKWWNYKGYKSFGGSMYLSPMQGILGWNATGDTVAVEMQLFHRPVWEALSRNDVRSGYHRLLVGGYAPWGRAFAGWTGALQGWEPDRSSFSDDLGRSEVWTNSMYSDFFAWYRHRWGGQNGQVTKHHTSSQTRYSQLTLPIHRVVNKTFVIANALNKPGAVNNMCEARVETATSKLGFLNPYGILSALGAALVNACKGRYPNGGDGFAKGEDLMGLVGVKGLSKFAKSNGQSVPNHTEVLDGIREFWKGHEASQLFAGMPTQWGTGKSPGKDVGNSRGYLQRDDVYGNTYGYNTWGGYLFAGYPRSTHFAFATGTGHHSATSGAYYGGNYLGTPHNSSFGTKGNWIAPSGKGRNKFIASSGEPPKSQGIYADWPMPLVGAYQKMDSNGNFLFPEDIKENRKQFEKTVENEIVAAQRAEKVAFADATAAFQEYRAITDGDVFIPFSVLERIVNDNIGLQDEEGQSYVRFDSGDHILVGNENAGGMAGHKSAYTMPFDTWAKSMKEYNDTQADPKSPYGAGLSGGIQQLDSSLIAARYKDFANPDQQFLAGLPNANSDTVYFMGWLEVDSANSKAANKPEDVEVNYTEVPDEINQLVSLPSKICNHPYLISTDPRVCLLPGQLGVGTTLVNGVPKYIDQGVPNIDKFKKFTDDPERQYGYLSNILVNTEAIRKAFENATTIKDAMQKILDQMSNVCGNIWNFKFEIDGDGSSGTTRIIDANFANSKCEKVVEFPVMRMDSIVTDYSLQSKIPNAMAVMALYGNNTPFSDGTTRNDLYELGNIFADLAHENIQFPINTTKNDAKEDSTFKVPDDNFERISTLQTLSTRIHTYQNPEDFVHANQLLTAILHDRVGSGTDTGYGKNALLDHNIIPLKMSFTLDGISGIHFGYALTSTHLPARYRDTVCFQVTNVKHQLTNSKWRTTIEAIMRRRPSDMSVYTIGTGEERYMGNKGLKNPRHMGNFEIEQSDGSTTPTNVTDDKNLYENIEPTNHGSEGN